VYALVVENKNKSHVIFNFPQIGKGGSPRSPPDRTMALATGRPRALRHTTKD